MFSEEKRCHYQNSALVEVICQFRFPRILSINANAPVYFQEKIRKYFPKFSVTTEKHTQPPINNYQFASQDGTWRINLTCDTIAFSTSCYSCWEDFAERLDGPLAEFIKHYAPAYFERVGLRYVNFFSRKKLGLVDALFSDMFASEYLGFLNQKSIPEKAINRNTVDADLDIGNGCRVQLHAGPGLVNIHGNPSKEVHFVLDFDYYMQGNLPVNYSAGALQTLHSKTYPVFRGAITDLLHNAMEPVDI